MSFPCFRKKEYVKYLKEKHNIIAEWQVPHSPETNMLDLCVWMALQSYTDHLHKKKVMQPYALAESVYEAYAKINSNVVKKAHEQWKLVLKLIIAGRGSNNLVESSRGLKVNLANLPSVPDLDSDDEETVRGLIQKAEDEDVVARNGDGGNNTGTD